MPTLISPQMVDAALGYARRGWPVFPLHGITEAGCCTCTEAPNCRNPGKHPRTAHGVQDATTAAAVIWRWWQRWPGSNVGIATGKRSMLLVLDVDPRHGGVEQLLALQATGGRLPATVEVLTGGGGRHIYLRHVGTIGNSSLALGVDVRCEGGYVVAPPSLHASGRRYDWEASSHPDEVLVASTPGWLVDLLSEPRRKQSDAAVQDGAPIRDGERNTTLASLAGTMRRRGMTTSEIKAALLVVNQQRCEPPLGEGEVRDIAVSIGRYEPAANDDHRQPAAPSQQQRNRPSAAPQWPEKPGIAAFHGLAGDIVHALEAHTEADPVAVLVDILAKFGIAAGREPHVMVAATPHRARVFAITVGPSGRGRKGTAEDEVRALYAEADPGWTAGRIYSGLSTGEGLIHAVRDRVIQVKTDRKSHEDYVETIDPGVDDKRLLVVETEFGRTLRVMGRDGNTLSAVIRQAFDKDDLRVMTKTATEATGAHIGITGHITLEELRRGLTDTEAANGFGNRFMWLCARRSKTLPRPGRPDDQTIASLGVRLREALTFARQTGAVAWSPEAELVWDVLYPDLTLEGDGLLGAVTARGEVHVLRVALLYALLDKSTQILPDHLRAAAEVWAYAARSAEYIFGDALGDPVADAILTRLRAIGELTRTEVRDLFGRNVQAARIEAAIDELVRRNSVRVEQRPTRGRPAEVIVLTSSTDAINDKDDERTVGDPASVVSVVSAVPKGEPG